jgi:transcription elongation factor Elf1
MNCPDCNSINISIRTRIDNKKSKEHKAIVAVNTLTCKACGNVSAIEEPTHYHVANMNTRYGDLCLFTCGNCGNLFGVEEKVIDCTFDIGRNTITCPACNTRRKIMMLKIF